MKLFIKERKDSDTGTWRFVAEIQYVVHANFDHSKKHSLNRLVQLAAPGVNVCGTYSGENGFMNVGWKIKLSEGEAEKRWGFSRSNEETRLQLTW